VSHQNVKKAPTPCLCSKRLRVLICVLIHILPGVLKRTRIQIALIHVHMTVHLSFSILERQRQALGVETIATLALFGGHDHEIVLELAMEAIRTGRVSNVPLQCR